MADVSEGPTDGNRIVSSNEQRLFPTDSDQCRVVCELGNETLFGWKCKERSLS